jgi:ribosomal protein S10
MPQIYIQRSLNFRSKKLIEMYAPFKEAFIQWKLQKYHPIPLLTSTAVASLRQIYDHEWDKMKKFDRQTISRRIQLESVDPTLWAVYQYLSGRVNRDMLRQCDGSMNEVIERMWLENWQKDECKSLKEKVFLKFKLDQIKNGDGGNSATAIGRQLFLREARNVLLHSRQIMDVDARAKTLWRLLSEDQKTVIIS